jgi:cardiolipin synthase
VRRSIRTLDREEDGYCLHPDALRPGNQVDLLVDGEAAYPSMLQAIGSARSEIDLETYGMRGDGVGVRFVDALCARASAGVAVRVIVDAVGSFGLPEAMRRQLAVAGAEIVDFHPVAPWRRRWGWSVRDHRKLLIVDGAMAFAGGMNLGDEYAPRAWGGAAWHDLHAKVQGPAVRELQKLFRGTWRYLSGTIPPREGGLGTPVAVGGARVQVLAAGSRRDRRAIRRHYLHALRHARRRILLHAAYFIPERGLRRVLVNAARRGVEVRLVLPRTSDVPAVQYASRATYAALLRAGVHIHEWLPSVLHAKTIVVDGAWGAIGSYNLDERSLSYNWELTLAIVDRAWCAALERAFEADLSSCASIALAEWSHRPFWEKVLERLFYTFRKWL